MDRQGGALGPRNHIRVRLGAIGYPEHDLSIAMIPFD